MKLLYLHHVEREIFISILFSFFLFSFQILPLLPFSTSFLILYVLYLDKPSFFAFSKMSAFHTIVCIFFLLSAIAIILTPFPFLSSFSKLLFLFVLSSSLFTHILSIFYLLSPSFNSSIYKFSITFFCILPFHYYDFRL